MKKSRALILLLLLAASAGAQELAAPAGPRPDRAAAVTEWLSSRSVPLKTVEPGHGSEDLRPLRRILRGVRVVGLGEATHGTKEFFRLKHRLVEFLVREMGFNVFAIEASYPATLSINEYVLHGTGDRDGALAAQGLWAWDTREVTELVEWMRRYNRSLPEARRVKFLGFDMHNNEEGVEAVSSYLKQVAPERAESLAGVFKALRPTGLGRQHFEYTNLGAAEKIRNLARLNELIGFLYLNQTRFTRQTSAAEFEGALQHARILAQFADIYRRPDVDPADPTNTKGRVRDFYMAENIERLVSAERPGSRVIVWAHNDHIGDYQTNMGALLRKSYGAEYYALGFGFNRGGFQARELDQNVTIGALNGYTIGPAPEGTVEWFITRAGGGNRIIDFRQAAGDAAISQWLGEPRPMRTIGLGYAPGGPEPLHRVRLKETFDGLVFIENTTRAEPNPTGVRGSWSITAR